MAIELVEHLRAFNRKERFLLVGQALDNPQFALGESFRDTLSSLLDRSVPSDAYCAMDYHLDWLYAALKWSCDGVYKGNVVERSFMDQHPDGSQKDLKITGNQSDVDLLVAWADERGRGQVVMIEAKGYTRWDPKQMSYKAARLLAIFGSGDDRPFPQVDAHLVLAGPPPEPKNLPKDQWPDWARQNWGPDAPAKYFLPLEPPSYETVAVERIQTISGSHRKPSQDGAQWHIRDAPWPGVSDSVPAGHLADLDFLF